MDLQKLNLVELNDQEKREVEGGILPLLILGAICLLTSSCAAKKAPVFSQPRH